MTRYMIAGAVIVLIALGLWFGLREVPPFGDVAESADTAAAVAEKSEESARFSDTEPGFEVEEMTHSLPAIPEPLVNGRTQWARYWDEMTPLEQSVYGSLPQREGLLRVGIQAGHWQLDEVPEELEGLRDSGGARGGGFTEQETVLIIARLVRDILEEKGVVVDLLPATIPVDYVADAFISIHADGSTNTSVSGFKIAAPRRDFSGKSEALVDALYDSYSKETKLRQDSSITRRMNGYYAFNWRRYDHALHPMTPAAIVETGFMTNAGDRSVIVGKPELAARGIAEGILAFLAGN